MSGTGKTFTSVLVANRGEIALRVMQSARALGLDCIAVYTDADRHAPHVAFADRAVNIGEGPVGDSYLNANRILQAARDTGAGAVHPGYGFLSENTEFAAACIAAGLVFVGPPAEAVELMGNKAAAKRKMIAAGVPCVPGYEGEDQSDAVMAEQADKIGYPVMIKAAAGGGGRGMRLVQAADGFGAALAAARSESLHAFGSDQIILERAVIRPRHVEIQIFADSHGNVVHLGERDCSVQRRHQKVVEEAPCPVMTDALRAAMGAAAVEAAKSIGYLGAGTVEFLLDEAGEFYFLEMNTRLQVEHPVTEMVTGRDLVALQFAVARGEALGFSQDDVRLNGHAIEARLYAEDPNDDFLPSSGLIHRWQPGQGAGIRVDGGIAEGQEVSPFYDPMLAKIIAHGDSREQARGRLIAALQDTVLFGPASNRDFLLSVLKRDTFRDGHATTAFIAEEFGDGIGADAAPVFADIAAIAALWHRHMAQAALARAVVVAPEMLGWGSPGSLRSRLVLGLCGQVWKLTLTSGRDGTLTVSDGADQAVVTVAPLRVDGQRVDLRGFEVQGDRIFAATAGKSLTLDIIRAASSASARAGGSVTAPMHGLLIEVLVKPGDKVEVGTRLAVLEAMKMQHELLAEMAGTVTFANAPGQVRAGDLLVEIAGDEA
ncbi:MAG: ATP-grasp domain-containing protein [Rhodobacteraceae bacterium]|nr:ATP-grasp domain-containing protein [Paracoccaceae bacterium]